MDLENFMGVEECELNFEAEEAAIASMAFHDAVKLYKYNVPDEGFKTSTTTMKPRVYPDNLPTNGSIHITDLPPETLQIIFRKLSFDNVAKLRPVCQYFNKVASALLNSEFSRLRLSMQNRFQNIKAQMPRRESARRKHPLARESDIIETLHMRLTLLHMTFGKHIERKHCCFFAGEILDEVYRILSYVKTTPSLNRAYKVTDELFDLSTMAMEYFKECIEPTLPEISYFGTELLDCSPAIMSSPKAHVSLLEDSSICSSVSSTRSPVLESLSNSSSSSSSSSANSAVNKRLRKLRDTVKKNNSQVVAVKQELKLVRKKVVSQQRQMNELKARNEEYDRKFQNTSRKLSAVLQELSRCKTELQYWRSKSPATQCSCGKITPVHEFKDTDVFVGDNSSDRILHKNKNRLVGEFKPISDDQESFVDPPVSHPSMERMFTIVSMDPSSMTAPTSMKWIFRDVDDDSGNIEETEENSGEYPHQQSGVKRKRDDEDEKLIKSNKKLYIRKSESKNESDLTEKVKIKDRYMNKNLIQDVSIRSSFIPNPFPRFSSGRIQNSPRCMEMDCLQLLRYGYAFKAYIQRKQHSFESSVCDTISSAALILSNLGIRHQIPPVNINRQVDEDNPNEERRGH